MERRASRSLGLGFFLSLVASAPAFPIALPDPVARAASRYDLTVRVDPLAGTIDCRVLVTSPASATFTLARDLEVARVEADGRARRFAEAAPTSEGVREVTIEGPLPARLAIEYAGRLDPGSYPKILSLVNGVRPGYVELASYAGWYPRFRDGGSFRFHLRAELPAGYVGVANGRALAADEWESDGATHDIVLLAAPGLERTQAARRGVTVELYSTALPDDYVRATLDGIARAAEDIAALAGSRSPGDLVRVVYSPRPGWGYVRTPLIVVSEESALAARAQRFGPARDLRYVAHEIAHYWWHQADTGTPEDWLNEGLSEYSAWLAMEKQAGAEFADQLLAEYRQRSADSATTSAIAETPNGSPDREVNRYVRPVLLFDAARRQYGNDRVCALLRALHARFAKDRRATTAAFLDEVATVLGPEAKTTFSESLYRRRWVDVAAPPPALSPADARFLGTWTASLTQGSETHPVVLHLALKDGVVVATTDSPDQGVRDIPVPSVRVGEGRLHFGIGAFGVSYDGTLAASGDVIVGSWTQGGLATPLAFARAAAAGGGDTAR